MPSVIGYNNAEKSEHLLKNDFDGNLSLNVYCDTAAGHTGINVNGIPYIETDLVGSVGPFFLGTLTVPRGEFILSFASEAKIERVLLGEGLKISGMEEFDRLFANRKGQWVFERPRPAYSAEDLALLRRHGFFFTGAGDCSKGLMPSGVPLGGMGCGKLEICADGMFTAFTGNNNQDSPIYRLPGSFLAFGNGKDVRILRNDALGLPYEPLSDIRSNHEYPFANLTAADPVLPYEIRVNAFSPIIAGSSKDSSLPAVMFDVTLTSASDKEEDAVVCFSWENIINVGGSMNVTNGGERVFPLCFHTWNGSFIWSDRRVNKCTRENGVLSFTAEDDRGNPMSFGTHALWCSDETAEAVPSRSIESEDEQSFREYLCGNDGKLTDSGSEFRAGAWVVRKKLAPHGEIKLRFILAWYMPCLLDVDGHDWSVRYTNDFSSAEEILAYCRENHDRLYAESKQINDILHGSTLPERFVHRLLDDRFVLSTCSWFDKDGNFSINEAPTGMGGCLGTLDQRTASQCLYTTFYPELDDRELELFRLSQAEDGMCAHEIGFATIKLWARPFSKWPDLVASYIIQVYHHYQRTGDKEFLRRHWPHIVKAVDWTGTMDDMNCGIPYICTGRGTTYDNQFWEGINSFISTMQLAAYRVGSACAAVMGETETAKKWSALGDKAMQTRMKYLWDGENRRFINAYDPKQDKKDDSVFIASLAGEWAALRAGLKPDLDEKAISDAASAILSECFGENGLTDQGGRKDTTTGFTQYPLAYLASPAMYCGNSSVAAAVEEITDKVITNPLCSTRYSQALTYRFDGRRHGLPYYMTAPASWNLLEACAGLKADLGSGTLRLSPKGEGRIKLPVFLTNAWFYVEKDETSFTLTPLREIASYAFRTIEIEGEWKLEGKTGEFDGTATRFEGTFEVGSRSCVFTK